MRTIVAILAPLLFVQVARSQPRPARLIVRGDDMGYTHSGNEAIIRSYKDGIEKSVEVIVASPWFPEAVKLLQQNPGIDVGVHLAITSEWDNIKWRPLSDCPSLKDSNGYFRPKVFPDKSYPGQSIQESNWQIADIEKEFRAQIELAMKRLPHITHISSHMGCTGLTEEVRALAKRLAKEYRIDIDPTDYEVISVGYAGPNKTPADKIQSFMKMLDKLEPGKTYLFLDHPGLDDEELRAVWHVGYENVATDRQGVTDLFTSDKVKAYIKQKGIQVIGYNDLVK